MKKPMLHFSGIAVGLSFLFLVLFINYSCQKESVEQNIPEGQQRVSIRLSDNPVNFDAVNVDIQQVEVLVLPDSCGNPNSGNWNNGFGFDHWGCFHDHNGDFHNFDYRCAVWDTLNIRAGVYNLLDLSNGADTLLASGLTIAGKILQIRLLLGASNSVVIDSVSYPLSLWNNYNRITINVKGENVEEITPGDLQLWLDFDAGRSIVKVSNNHFILKPFLRIWLPAQTASIEGKVVPEEAEAIVSAIANNDTLVAIPDRGDKFKIRGLRGTSATVFINATANGYRDTTLTAVPLRTGEETDIGTIQLHN